MKTNFNFALAGFGKAIRHAFGMTAWVLAATAGLVVAGPTGIRSAAAQATYYSPRAVLADFFPRSQTVTFQHFELSGEQRERLQRRLGYALPRAAYNIYIAKTGEAIDGYAVLDEENGEHLPISFAVKVSPQGVAQRAEIMVYRERFGDEIRDPRFRVQFIGKSAADPLRPGDEIVAVSGATISSRAMAIGVRRALVLVDELILAPRPRSLPQPAVSANQLPSPVGAPAL